MYTGARGVAYDAAYVTGTVAQNLCEFSMYWVYWAHEHLPCSAVLQCYRYRAIFVLALSVHELCNTLLYGCRAIFKTLGADNPLEEA